MLRAAMVICWLTCTEGQTSHPRLRYPDGVGEGGSYACMTMEVVRYDIRQILATELRWFMSIHLSKGITNGRLSIPTLGLPSVPIYLP